MNLLLLEPHEVDDSGTVRLSDDRARHLHDVLRASAGQRLRVGITDGPLGTGEVRAIEAGRAVLHCAFAETPPVPRVDLLLAVPRPKVLRRLWPQLSALGLGRIVLTNAEKVERNYFDTHLLDEAHYRPLLLDGLEQARDTRVPRVTVHRRLRVLVEDELDALSDATVRIVAHPGAALPIATAMAAASESARVLLAVGPEGGWNAFELDLLDRHGFVAADLGSRRPLRSDTACIALLALAHAALRG